MEHQKTEKVHGSTSKLHQTRRKQQHLIKKVESKRPEDLFTTPANQIRVWTQEMLAVYWLLLVPRVTSQLLSCGTSLQLGLAQLDRPGLPVLFLFSWVLWNLLGLTVSVQPLVQ